MHMGCEILTKHAAWLQSSCVCSAVVVHCCISLAPLRLSPCRLLHIVSSLEWLCYMEISSVIRLALLCCITLCLQYDEYGERKDRTDGGRAHGKKKKNENVPLPQHARCASRPSRGIQNLPLAPSIHWVGFLLFTQGLV